jgi:Tfp pilus assembly protein PilO
VKDLGNKLIANLHYIILLYGVYGAYVLWDEHSLVVADVETQVQGLDADLIMSKRKLDEIQDFIKKADEYKTRVEGVAKNIETVQRQLPAETNDGQILTFFNSEMNMLNIKDAQLQPGKEESLTYFISKDYNLKAKGTFLQFLIFFERIGTANRIYNIKNLKLVASEDSKKGRFQMVSTETVIQAFRFNPDYKVERGFEGKKP